MSSEPVEKLISVASLVISIELVLFKFLPDIGPDFRTFEVGYLTPGSVFYARFLGNYILYDVAKGLSHVLHSADPRLHPLRVAAAILTPLYAVCGAYFALRGGRDLAWRYFLAPYALAVLMGLYVFYPADMPALACLSTALWFLLEERLLPALLLTLVTGLFRESAFHMVWMVAAWAWCARSRPWWNRLVWPTAFALVFAVEYVAIRHFFPGPVSSAGGLILDPRVLFLDKSMLSLTVICSLGLAALFPLACLILAGNIPADDWRRDFFIVNCCTFPGWIVFYRMMNGNPAEFRMLLPAILPCIYGIAIAKGVRSLSASNPTNLSNRVAVE